MLTITGVFTFVSEINFGQGKGGDGKDVFKRAFISNIRLCLDFHISARFPDYEKNFSIDLWIEKT